MVTSPAPAASNAHRTDALERDLGRIDAEVRFDLGSRGAYASDSSNYRQVPLGVVVPRSVDAAEQAVRTCATHDVALLSRGGGTSLAGQTTNAAVVVDWTKYCTKVVEVDPERRTCVVEPGIALDDLNRTLEPYGLMFGPRPATHRTCTVGGMIGNNSCGATAQAYGKTVDNVRRLEILTYGGMRCWVGPTDDGEFAALVREGGELAELVRGLRRLRDANLAAIRARYPDIPRRVSGYNLDSLLPEHGFDLARMLVGSEGTLVTVLRAELELVPVPAAVATVVLGYRDIAAAADAVPHVLTHRPWQLEGIDDVLVGLERSESIGGPALASLPPGAGWLIVKFDGTDTDGARTRAERLVDDLRGRESGPEVTLYEDRARAAGLQALRDAALAATAHPPDEHDTWPGWEDSAVPPDRLGDYLRDLRRLVDEHGYPREETSLYGHFGQGCVHTRIPFELRTAEGVQAYRRFVEAAAKLVVRYGGSLSGEHGDGQARGELLTTMYGSHVVELFGQVKNLFDPQDRMNPGKVVRPNPLDGQLRLGPDYTHLEPPTFFDFPHDDHRFSKAALRCVGVGSCRSSTSEGQVMCPSYMVTREEEHSTRGRARLLFEMVRGDHITDGWRSTEVRDALDLCLACKGCKSDCPVNVDMATYKAEFLAHHYAGRMRPMAHYSMGWLPVLAALARRAPRATNLLAHAPGLAGLAKTMGGVAPERELPYFAAPSFTASWRARARHDRPAPRGTVVLWPDTFTNSFDPQVARSAVHVLEAAGWRVEVPAQPVCCGLTWISTGQLAVARRALRRTTRVLRDHIRDGTRIVVLEPSCAAVFRSDAPELCAGDEDLRRLAAQVRTLAELLEDEAPDWTPPRRLGAEAIVQTHCHHHAVLGTDADDRLYERIGLRVERLQSGCCGLAGDFGFTRGHYDVSRAAGERVLLPAVRAAPPTTEVVADGFSCRTQITQGDTGRLPVHLAQLVERSLEPPNAVPTD